MSDLRQVVKNIIDEIELITPESFSFMEVCGTHTMSIAKSGIRTLLPKRIKIISGPGCPVCVTASGDIKAAIDLCKIENVIVATFGDMLRVPCNGDSLQNYKNVRVVYSPMEALNLAQEHSDKEIVFLGIGFETTAPLTAVTIKDAKKRGVKNFSVLCMHKLVPQALRLIINSKNLKLDGFLLPGHVCAITGSRYFDFISEYKLCSTIAGFEAVNILSSIRTLIKDHVNKNYAVYNNYTTVVSNDGNRLALDVMEDVFQVSSSVWRGIGKIDGSSLEIKGSFSDFDAVNRFKLKKEEIKDPVTCRCGDILKGEALPTDCRYYGKECSPSNPIGPCMVSTEGTCAAYYKYLGE